MPRQYSVLLDAPTQAASRIPIAKLGDYHNSRYGDFKITAGDVADWQKHLEKLPGGRALIDEDHLANKPSPHRRTEAAGWVTDIQLDGQQVWGSVDWTSKGREAVEDGRYLFTSPTYGPWSDDTGATYDNVLSGVALTNRPFLTSMPQIMLASDEAISRALELDPSQALMSLALDGEFGEAAQQIALEQDDGERQKLLAELTTSSRNDLKDSDFALPNRRYPIHDLAHARNALARVAGNGTPEEQSKVKAAVYRRFPALKPDAKNLDASDRRDQMKFSPDTVKSLAALAGIEDEAKIAELVELGAAEGTDEAKLLEAIEAAKPELAPVKTFEEQAEEQGVKILTADEHTELTKAAEEGAEAKRQLEADGTETKTLEQQAAEAGKALVDEGRLTTLEDQAHKVPALEVAVKKLSDDAAEAQKQLENQRFESAYDAAERDGKAIPSQKDRFKGFFELDAEGTLAMLSEQPALVNVKPKGRNVQAPGDDAPEGTHAEHYQLEQEVSAYIKEHEGTDYATALAAITGVRIPTSAGAI